MHSFILPYTWTEQKENKENTNKPGHHFELRHFSNLTSKASNRSTTNQRNSLFSLWNSKLNIDHEFTNQSSVCKLNITQDKHVSSYPTKLWIWSEHEIWSKHRHLREKHDLTIVPLSLSAPVPKTPLYRDNTIETPHHTTRKINCSIESPSLAKPSSEISETTSEMNHQTGASWIGLTIKNLRPGFALTRRSSDAPPASHLGAELEWTTNFLSGRVGPPLPEIEPSSEAPADPEDLCL